MNRQLDEHSAAPPPRPPELPERLRAAVRAVAADPAADDAVARLAGAGGRFDRVAAALPKSLAIARAIVAAAREAIERDVDHAIRLAAVAIGMTDELRGDDPLLVAITRARALKEKALALRHAARHDDALASLDLADATLVDLPAAAYDRAVIDLVRSTILGEVERLDESDAIAERIEPLFEEFGDRRMTNLCRFHRANLAARRGDWAAAYRKFVAIAGSGEIDELTRAQVEQNAGQAAVELGETAVALAHLAKAAGTFESLAMPSEVARCTWVTGRVAINEGRHSRALEILEPVRESFLRLGLVDEAGLAALDMTRCLLAIGRRGEAQYLCRGVIDAFEEAGLNRRAVDALTLLHDHIDIADGHDVASIAGFIGALRSHPDTPMPAGIFRRG